MKRLLLPLFLLMTLTLACSKTPSTLKQYYTCKGTDPNGTAYTVTLETRKAGEAPGIYDVRQISEAGEVVVVGQGFIEGSRFVVNLFFPQGNGVGSYNIQGNMLTGQWLGLGTGKLNPEVCTPATKAPEIVAPVEAPNVDPRQAIV